MAPWQCYTICNIRARIGFSKIQKALQQDGAEDQPLRIHGYRIYQKTTFKIYRRSIDG
jgi:hypothetical protein